MDYYVMYTDDRNQGKVLIGEYGDSDQAVDCAKNFIQKNHTGVAKFSWDSIKVFCMEDGWSEVVVWIYRRPGSRP